MPGSSLWLVPPPDSDLYRAIHSLILQQIPTIYPNASQAAFTPHITLTADTVPPGSSDPQKWLDDVALPDSISQLEVAVKDVEVGNVYFKKLTMSCEKTAELCELAVACRVAGVQGEGLEEARKWVEESYGPHCSLMYSGLPEDKVNAKRHEVGQAIEETKQQCPESRTAKGAEIWLVSTERSLEDWKPIATRSLPDVVWEWRT